MEFNLDKAIEVLRATPDVLDHMLGGLSEDWTHVNEGGETWSAFDVVGHLILGDNVDWIPRLELILSDDDDTVFDPFDRLAMLDQNQNRTLEQLLKDFADIRSKNLQSLRSLKLTDADLDKHGAHPAFGSVTARQLLATWVVHDLNHIAQIARVMAKQYREETGPWHQYLRILGSKAPDS